MKSFLSSIKKKTRAQSASATAIAEVIASPAPAALVAYSYTGGEFGITFQRARSKYVDTAGPTRLLWNKEQRLGITFVEKEDGAITVKSTDAEGVAIGQELIGVNNRAISGLDFLSVMNTLKAASSPCQLDFTPPPSPIVVSQVEPNSSAHMQGIVAGMVLQSVNDVSMIGATLSEVNHAVVRASNEYPAMLKFAPKATRVLTRSDSDPAKSGLRNTACIAAVVAVLAV
ncbi:hypothetical protein Gpo141_00005583 [Globisporangium polare]